MDYGLDYGLSFGLDLSAIILEEPLSVTFITVFEHLKFAKKTTINWTTCKLGL